MDMLETMFAGSRRGSCRVPGGRAREALRDRRKATKAKKAPMSAYRPADIAKSGKTLDEEGCLSLQG